jgi:hypothetical protein
MPERTAKANAARSRVRARVEHVFAQPKDRMGLFIRPIGLKRAEAKIMLANLACNMNRLIFHEQRAAMGSVRPEIKTALTKKHNDAANRRLLLPIQTRIPIIAQIMWLMEVSRLLDRRWARIRLRVWECRGSP